MEIKLSKITCELDFIYYCDGKKFFTREEAVKYMRQQRFQDNEDQLIKECQEKLRTSLAVGFAQKDYK